MHGPTAIKPQDFKYRTHGQANTCVTNHSNVPNHVAQDCQCNKRLRVDMTENRAEQGSQVETNLPPPPRGGSPLFPSSTMQAPSSTASAPAMQSQSENTGNIAHNHLHMSCVNENSDAGAGAGAEGDKHVAELARKIVRSKTFGSVANMFFRDNTIPAAANLGTCKSESTVYRPTPPVPRPLPRRLGVFSYQI